MFNLSDALRRYIPTTATESLDYNHTSLFNADRSNDTSNGTSAIEAFGASFDMVAQEAPKTLKSTPQPITRFCSKEIILPAVPARTPFIAEAKSESGTTYIIYLNDQIGPDLSEAMSLRRYEDILVILKTASEQTNIMFYINSMGGCINWMFKIMTAIITSKAQVTTIAAGSVMSAAAPIWAAGKVRKIIPNSIFMFHNPAHSDMGTTSMVSQSAQALDDHIYTNVFKPFLDAGYITEEEFATIKKRQDVYITGIELSSRIESKSTTTSKVAEGA